MILAQERQHEIKEQSAEKETNLFIIESGQTPTKIPREILD
jgi:hypothetical protein